MNNNYIIKKDKTYVSDENGMYQRETTTTTEEVMKTENNIETLSNELGDKEEELSRAKYTRKTKRQLFFLIPLECVLIPLVLGILLYLCEAITAQGIPTTDYVSETINFMKEIGRYAAAVGVPMTLLQIPGFISSKRTIKKLIPVIQYIENQIKKEEQTLDKLLIEGEITSAIQQEEIRSLTSYNEEFAKNTRRRIELANQLMNLRKHLLDMDPTYLDEHLGEDGYTPEEIHTVQGELNKVISFTPKKQDK